MSGGNCPETPRQKMIGMMYLFYTALMALNVSNEVLNAFVAVNDGITTTTKNFSIKTASLYSTIDAKYAEQPAKYEALQKEAHNFEKDCNNIFDLIDRIKLKCLQASDPEASLDSLPKKMDDINAAPAVMDKEAGGPYGDSLRAAMDNFRAEVLSMSIFRSDKKDPQSAIDTSSSFYKRTFTALNTPDKKDEDADLPWELGYVRHMPLIGTISLLSKLQSDIRNVEAEVLQQMVADLEGLDIRISELTGLVSTNSSFVVSGGNYTSNVFIGARDTTMRPTIYITTSHPFYDSIVKPNGEIVYKLRDGVSYDTLPLDEAGRGTYSVSNAGVGDHSYGGLIYYNSNVGEQWLPYRSTFMVGQSGFTVSATKCNVFYRGLENPVEVSVSGYPKESVSVSISKGSIKPSKDGYVVTIPAGEASKEVNINVSVKTESGVKSLGSKKFNVLNVPPPTILVAGGYKDGADIPKAAISKNPFLAAKLESDFFPFEGVSYSIAKYDFFYTVRGVTTKETVNGSQFTSKVSQEIAKMSAGTAVTFSNVFYNGPSGTRQTNGVTVRLK